MTKASAPGAVSSTVSSPPTPARQVA